MDIKLEVIHKVYDCFEVAEKYFETSLNRPSVSFDIRGQDAGRAYFKKKLLSCQTSVKFNEVLLEHNPMHFLQEVVAHECAHLIAYELYGSRIKPHGKEWKSIMQQVFKLEPNVTHRLDVSLVSKKPFMYQCQCVSQECIDENGVNEYIGLSKRQHHHALKGTKYICQKCRSPLVFSYEKIAEKPTEKTPIKPLKIMRDLLIHVDDEIIFNAVVAQRLQHIMNKKIPERVFSYPDLSNNHAFSSWLRKSSLIRKYKGALDVLDSNTSQNMISHAVVITNNKCFERDKLRLPNVKGSMKSGVKDNLIIRSIIIK